MANNNSTITVRILGNADNAIGELGKLDGALGKLGKGALLAGGALGTAFVGAGTALFAIGEQFDSIENTIIRGTGATGEALDGLLDQAKDVLATVPESGDVVAGVIADVNTFFGQTGDTLEESSRLFLDFARVTGADVTNSIAGLDAAFTQFGESPETLNEALGDFTRISQATGAPVDQLIGQLETFGPLFANAGFSIEETTAIFGQLEQAGVDVTRVGPALNKFFRDAAAAGEDPRVALEGVVAAIGDAESSTEALNIASQAFGAEGAQRLTSAIRSGNFDLAEFNGLLGDGAGLVDEQAEATESFSDKLNTLKNTVLVALAPAAEAVFEAVGEAIDALAPFIEQFAVWFAEQLPGWIEEARAVFEEFGPVVLEVLQTVADVFVENWPAIAAVLEVVLDRAKLFAGFIQANWPIIQQVIKTAFDLISVAFAVLTGDFDLLKSSVERILNDLKAGIEGIFNEIVDGISGLGGRIADAAVGIFDGVKDAFRSAINFIIDGWNNLSFSVPEIGTPFGSFGGFSVGTPDIPRLATGAASFAPMLAIVGDNPQAYRDPEITAPQSFIRDAVRDVLNEFGGVGGPSSTTINANGYVDTEALARDVDRAQRRRDMLTGSRFAFAGDVEAA